MSSDLETFRDHCRKMAAECRQSIPQDEPGIPASTGTAAPGRLRTDAVAARQLWLMLAEEVDAYLERDDAGDDEPLWGDS